MTQWNFLSSPLLAAFFTASVIPILTLTLVYLLQEEKVMMLEWEVLSLGTVWTTLPILIDKVSLVFSLTVMTISFSVMLFSVSYMSGDQTLTYFIYMVMAFVFSMNMLIYIPHLMILLLGWDGLGLTSYLLVIYYNNDSSLAAGMVTALSNRIGDSLLIVAIAWGYLSGHWLFSLMPYKMTWVLMLCIMVASMTKSAQIPFSAWLPAAMAAPTPVSSLVHSSTLVTAGVYLLIRFYPSLCTYPQFHYFIFYSGTLTCLMASLSAIYENDLKKVIALSTLSQLGVMFMALGLGLPNLAFFHLVTHALFKALLFVCAGTIIHSKTNTQDIRLMGGIWSSMPMTCTCLNVANLALCGFPFMAGFYSKDLIVESFMMDSLPMSTATLMVLSISLTSAYTIRMSVYSLWSPFKSYSVLVTNDESIVGHSAMIVLALGASFGGAFMGWLLSPFYGTLTLPKPLKLLVLGMIFMLGALTYWSVVKGVGLIGTSFMGSMWFMTFITSPILTSWSLTLGKKLLEQEATWMEVISGKGVLGLTKDMSVKHQLTQNLGFSQLMTSVTFIALLLLMLI